MLGYQAKLGIESTFERIHALAGGRLSKVTVTWVGSGAGVKYDTLGNVFLLFPAIEDTAELSKSRYNDYIGFAIHELGHVWFTQQDPWDEAVKQYGPDLGRIINGLEDPRIEQKMIDSGYALNSGLLFESLINNVLRKNADLAPSVYGDDDYVDPNEINNIAFQLAIEGRRLNGYKIYKPAVYNKSIYRDAIKVALNKAHVASSTKDVVEIAIDLYNNLPKREKKCDQQMQNAGDDKSLDQNCGQDEQGNDSGKQDANQEDGKENQSKAPSNGGFGDDIAIDPKDYIRESFSDVVSNQTLPRLSSFNRTRIIWE